MKRVFAFCLPLPVYFLCLCLASPVHAADMMITTYIPGRYVFLQITGAEPGHPLDKGIILNAVKDQFAKANVAQLQFAVYDAGKKPGDGVRASGEMNKDSSVDIEEFSDLTGTDGAQIIGKFTENIFGYHTTPKELYDAYSDNEVVADDDFKGKPVILEITVPQVAKDPFDKPYIKVGVAKHGLGGVSIYLDKNDPFLRRIKKGSKIIVRGYPKRFTMHSVVIDGVIAADENAILVDGQAVPFK